MEHTPMMIDTAKALFIGSRSHEPMPAGDERIITPDGDDVTLEVVIMRVSNNIVDYQFGHTKAMDALREVLAYAKRAREPEVFEALCDLDDPKAAAVIKEALNERTRGHAERGVLGFNLS